jgi:DNA invertase Pin-like site-specific DNA recombinase
LSRDAYFLLDLEKAKVEFVAVDMPHANRLTVGVMALVAEQEREAISLRTKAALQAAKARGVKLGNPKGHPVPATRATSLKGAAANRDNADAFAELLRPVLTELAELSAKATAEELNRRGVATARSGQWTATTVINVRRRLAS